VRKFSGICSREILRFVIRYGGRACTPNPVRNEASLKQPLIGSYYNWL
jgi:hypothetical protein